MSNNTQKCLKRNYFADAKYISVDQKNQIKKYKNISSRFVWILLYLNVFFYKISVYCRLGCILKVEKMICATL